MPLASPTPREFVALLEGLAAGTIRSKEEIHRAKLALCRTGSLTEPPTDGAILATIDPLMRKSFEPLLRTKPSRTASGVAVVAAMMRPAPCPHGVCIFCPGGPSVGTPQSYMGTEPAAMRGAQFLYDSYRQTRGRVDQLRATGHPTDKVDFIVLGGTFTTYSESYREQFVKGCYDALNGFTSPTLGDAMVANEVAESRMIGLTIETKPERFLPPDVEHSLGLGTTRVEFGVQSTFDDVLRRANRGHTVEDVRAATRRAKDAGLKVCYHMMPGLPGSNPLRDLESFRTIFEDPAFRPDMLKIYPTLVVPGTGLYELWRRGDYLPPATDETVDLLVAVKSIVPPWVRIQRIQREISGADIAAGLHVGNVRELARERLAAEGRACRCIRCREIGLRRQSFTTGTVGLRRIEYSSTGGRDVFLAFETEGDALVGYARLRRTDRHAYLRELKVLGTVVPIGCQPGPEWQHRGLGTRLLEACEEIAGGEWGFPALRVTSGVGVREYFRGHARRHGTTATMDGPYVRMSL